MTPPGGAAPQGAQVQIAVLGQYVKDISFESPNIRKLMSQQAEQPTLNLEMDVRPEPIGPSVYEATVHFKARAESKSIGTIFELEVDYAGIFRIENAPAEALEAFLNIQCPTLLFPFVRRIVADMTRDGGIMPPLMLDPVDFGALYARKRAQADVAGTA
ncbi:MAG: protein-export chaperone SecB [Proteobacteria bacterium]|nr:protein-export chaperone SecB [Pseudomonadota bacterium]